MKACLAIVTGMLVFLGLSACGGGSGGGSASATSEATGSYGAVGILMADGPADAYEHIWITITDVTLIPADAGAEEVVIFQSAEGYTLDLLALRDESFLLTLHDQIPAGTYAKIRVGVSAIVPEGGPCEEFDVKLPSDKIDFIPKGGLVIKAGETVYIKLDIDADKSINLHHAGHSDQCIFRPVVFVDIVEGEPFCVWRHPIRGTIEHLLDADDDGTTDGLILERERECLGGFTVRLDDDTIIFTEEGVFDGPSSLAVGQTVLVRGSMQPEGYLLASLVVIGDALGLKGTVDGNVLAGADETYTFTLSLDAGQALTGSPTVLVYPQTMLRSGCDTAADITAIADGTRLMVVGKYDTTSEILKAVGILLLPTQTIAG